MAVRIGLEFQAHGELTYGILFAWQEKEADVPGYHPTRLRWMVGTTEIPLIVMTTSSESRGIGLTVKESSCWH